MKQSFFEKLTGSKKIHPTQTPMQTINHKPAQNSPIPKQNINTQQKITPKEEIHKKQQVEKKNKEWLSESEGQLVLDIYQSENEIIIKSTLAGVKPEDIDITITNDMLSIKGTREKDEKVNEKDYYYQECYWGPFSRSVILPTEVEPDKIKASLKNGILTIKMLKSEKLKTKKIAVTEE